MADSIIKEGLITVNGKTSDSKSLFYNPTQVLNRDLSLIVLKTFIDEERNCNNTEGGDEHNVDSFKGVNVLEMLAATGIRGLRYIKELGDSVNYLLLNDLDRNSAESIVENARINGVEDSKYRVICADANLLADILTPPADIMRIMLMQGNIQKVPCGHLPTKECSVMKQHNDNVDRFLDVISITKLVNTGLYRNVIDVIDIDPYSSVSGFIDSAVKCVKSGGILLITSTDMPTLCGNNPLVSFYKYGGSSIKSPFCHELSLRVLLYCIATSAARYQRIIEPLLSCSIDFYVRVFVRVKYNPEACKKLASDSGILLMCAQCDAFNIMELGEYTPGTKQKPASLPSDFNGKCNECGGRIKIGGPLYIGKIHDQPFVTKCLNTANNAKTILPGVTMNTKIIGLLTSISEELEYPLYYNIPKLCQKWSLTTISPHIFKNTLEKLGYKASHFHREPQSLKTNAAPKVIMDIIRTHARMLGKTDSFKFLQMQITTENIDMHIEKAGRKKGVPRWMPNPTSHWGPKKMHKSISSSIVYEKIDN